MEDKMCLAEGLVIPAEFDKIGHNLNVAVVGGTGSGKTVSYTESKLAHTHNSSVVVPLAKKKIKDKYKKLFKERGYKVIDMDFTHPDQGDVGYDPLRYVADEMDAIQLARNIIGGTMSSGQNSNMDPYWEESAISILAAVILLVMMESKELGIKATFADVMKTYRSMKIDYSHATITTSLDERFAKLARRYRGNQATELWKTINGLGSKTLSCILSTANNAVDKIFSPKVMEMAEKEEHVDFRELGNKKVALFITTSPVNKTLQNYVNLFYADMIKVLFEEAESKENGKLEIPINIICDDFACGGKIRDFEQYISIFRAAGISVTLLLQSESQLSGMYGQSEATTISNNCDTYLYMGGMDIETCKNVALRMNWPLHKVLSLPLETVAVFRRGAAPYIGRRYQTFSDPVYQELMRDDSGNDDMVM